MLLNSATTAIPTPATPVASRSPIQWYYRSSKTQFMIHGLLTLLSVSVSSVGVVVANVVVVAAPLNSEYNIVL
jgi:hypothetical protein